jgi:hypothetical protein
MAAGFVMGGYHIPASRSIARTHEPCGETVGFELFLHVLGVASAVSRRPLGAQQPDVQKPQRDDDLTHECQRFHVRISG